MAKELTQQSSRGSSLCFEGPTGEPDYPEPQDQQPRRQSVRRRRLRQAPVAEEDEAKGYQRGEDEYVLLEDEELDAVGLESTRTIDIDMFGDADNIGWFWYDKPHFLTPDDPVGEEAFSVIRDAMASTKTVGISRLVLYRRELV